jgi:predicted dienelactone hydrolase
MRPIEILLSIANLLTFLVLAIRLPGAGRWTRHLAPVALLVAASQALLEGPRWQLIPAYVLAGLSFLVWVRRSISRMEGRVAHQPTDRPATGCGVALSVIGLMASSVLPIALPVFHFPPPSGPYGIGTVTHHWVNARRAEIFSTDPAARRELIVQIWYPAKPDPSALRALYMRDADAVMAALARIRDKPEFSFGHFKYVTTNAMSSAPVVGDQPSYPVLLFLEGATGFRQMNTFQVEDLVSHGYIVAVIDQPGAAAVVVFPDGHQAAGLTLAQFQATVSPSYLPDKSVPLLNGTAPKMPSSRWTDSPP